FDVHDGYVFNVQAPVTGAGSLAFDSGSPTFQSATGVSAGGGITNRGANVTFAGPLTTGAVSMTGSLDGVTTLNPVINTQAAFAANGITVTRGTLNATGDTINTGAFTQATGTSNFAKSTHASMTINGGTVNANGDLTSAGVVSVTNGTLFLNSTSNT